MDEYRRYRIEQAAAYLERIREMRRRTRTLEAEVAELRADAEGLGAMDYTRERVKTSPPGDRMAEVAGRLFERLDEFADEYEEFVAERERARSCMRKLADHDHYEVLVRRYLNGEAYRAIAEAMGYELVTIYKKRLDALDAFYDVMPYNERDPLPPAL